MREPLNQQITDRGGVGTSPQRTRRSVVSTEALATVQLDPRRSDAQAGHLGSGRPASYPTAASDAEHNRQTRDRWAVTDNPLIWLQGGQDHLSQAARPEA